MFEKITNKVAEKMGRSVKTQIVPIKNKVAKTVDDKVDLYSKILKLGVLIFLFIDGTRRVNNISNERNNVPSQIIINNYLSRKEDLK